MNSPVIFFILGRDQQSFWFDLIILIPILKQNVKNEFVFHETESNLHIERFCNGTNKKENRPHTSKLIVILLPL